MAAFAAATGRVRLGQMCTCMGYRNPAYLAKVAATIDVISEGRVEMGIGAGWYEHEWRAYGYGFPSAGERLGRLREGVEIFREMWTTGRATLAGQALPGRRRDLPPAAAAGTTVPGSARNGIPMWIAGGGEKKTLRIAAEYADYTNFDGAPEGFAPRASPARALRRRRPRLRRDRALGQLQRRHRRDERRGPGPARLDPRLLPAGGPVRGTSSRRQVKEFRGGPAVGHARADRREPHGLGKLGMTYAITYFLEAAYDTSGMELFEHHVIPALRSGYRRVISGR